MDKNQIKNILTQIIPLSVNDGYTERKKTVYDTSHIGVLSGNRLNSGTLRSQFIVFLTRSEWDNNEISAKRALHSDQRVFVQIGDDVWDVYKGADLSEKNDPILIKSNAQGLAILLQSERNELIAHAPSCTVMPSSQPLNNTPYQLITYGAPGTGKSWSVEKETKGKSCIRTTFHPDGDYSTFVGAYKPSMEKVPRTFMKGEEITRVAKGDASLLEEKRIVYKFVAQAFLEAYVAAWRKCSAFLAAQDDEARNAAAQFLVIEEINRGNCAQIFGDLFQLLDRNAAGFSEYPIKADADMKKQLNKLLSGLIIENAEAINALYKGKDVVSQVLDGDVLLLPSNLYIWATMNTSDQSLFPIDSAFKRRWDWRYVRIDDAHKGWKIEANGKRYDWWDFLERVNKLIGDTTSSEDKKLGYFFCKTTDGIITAETFVSKVVFYLWNDVFKDYEFEGDIFVDEDKASKLSFDKFYQTNFAGQTVVNEAKVDVFLTNLGVKFADNNTMLEGEEEDEDGNTTSSSSRDFTKYSVNGIGRYGKNRLAAEAVKQYVLMNPSLSAEEVVTTWKSLGNIVAHFIETKEEHDARQDNSKRSQGIPCGGTVIYVEVNGYGSNGKVDVLIEAVNRQNWGLTLSKVES